MNKWYVITGAPCSGKTTLANELQRRGYQVEREVARAYFTEEIGKGRPIEELRADELVLQQELVRRKVALEASLPRDQVIFLDRAIPDARAYLKVAGVNEPPEVAAAVDYAEYAGVFLLDHLPLSGDAVRIEDEERQHALDSAHEDAYEGHGYPVWRVPVMSLEERVAYVLDRVEKEPSST